MTTTLAVANQKGGVGKTTTVASLGIALVERGLRVLLVDLDPQGGLTFSLGIDPEDVELTAGDVMLGHRPVADALVVTDEGVHLLPSSIALTRAEEQLAGRTGRERRLSVALDAVAADYDWILVDCPPTLGVLTVGALAAADEVLVPLQCETLSHRGVGQLLDTIHDVQQLLNPRRARARRPAHGLRRTHAARPRGARDDRRDLRPGGARAGHPEVRALRRGSGDRPVGARHLAAPQGRRGVPRGGRPARGPRAGDRLTPPRSEPPDRRVRGLAHVRGYSAAVASPPVGC